MGMQGLRRRKKTCLTSDMDRLQCLQHGLESLFYRKTTPHFRCLFLAGIKTIGAMMLYFGCNTSQPIPNIFADKVQSDKFKY